MLTFAYSYFRNLNNFNSFNVFFVFPSSCSLSSSRPALSVVIYPLLHEDLANVIRGMPLCHLDEITLFKSRVAEEPMKL